MVSGIATTLGERRLVQRYAVPGWMIAECADARERGDWRAACEAARVTVAFDDPGPVADLLAGFAPDLLRWHLPRSGSGDGGLATGLTYVLAPDGPVGPASMVLTVRSPDWVTGSQRLTLDAVRFADLSGPIYPLAPQLWDNRRVGDVRNDLCAAGLPLCSPTVYRPTAELCSTCDRACQRRPNGPLRAWTATGWQIDESASDHWPPWDVDGLSRVDPRLAARELRRIVATFGIRSCELGDGRARRRPYDWSRACLDLTVDGPRIAPMAGQPSDSGTPGVVICLHPALLRIPADVDLISRDRIGTADLHPLVRAALFPGVDSGGDHSDRDAAVPAGVEHDQRIRVRCGGRWHWIRVRDGRLELLDHSEAERRREHALRAFGGRLSGCFRAELAWKEGTPGVPRRLLAQRRDLWRRMQHGGSRVVLALLDAGMSPHIRDLHRRTLLHRLHQFEHAELLPRLLAEGLDVNAISGWGYTPMCEALVHGAPADLLVALHEAGAYPPLSSPGG
ncbi:hypothetical protein [Catellatospora methionotrophica]|uniref:hypothetical protein n=1 Tax=Catellatospora methionotrophica TaxID=121620 RepID=UPI0033E0FA52